MTSSRRAACVFVATSPARTLSQPELPGERTENRGTLLPFLPPFARRLDHRECPRPRRLQQLANAAAPVQPCHPLGALEDNGLSVMDRRNIRPRHRSEA